MTNQADRSNLPNRPEPFWRTSVDIPSYPALNTDIDVDVAIVGGGISGVTAAYLLAQAGLHIALIEADTVLGGATGHTTAKLTAQHNLIYYELIKHVGRQKARLYYETNQAAIDFVDETAKRHGIDCAFMREDAYVYAVTEKYADKIDKEFRAYQALGIDGAVMDSIPLGIKIQNAIQMRNQAQFHPLKFLYGLLSTLGDNRVDIFEHTVATGIENGETPIVTTRSGPRIQAKHVLSCAHFPFYDGMGMYFTRMYASRGYVIAGASDKSYPGGMYISAETPSISVRSVDIDGEPCVLISGADHRTGEGGDVLDHYKELETFGKEVLELRDVKYRWSNQDLFTLDNIPYIGKLSASHPNVFVATGYKKWGMTTGIAAAHLLRDMVVNRENAAQWLYTPQRFYADPSLRHFFSNNITVAAHLIGGKMDTSDLGPDDVDKEEGTVIDYRGERAGAYRDKDGTLYVVDTTCTHLGCELHWNHGDRTWDCPCHGSRFHFTGEVVEGPADKPLRRLDTNAPGES